MHSKRYNFSSIKKNKFIYVFGGLSENGILANTERFNLKTKKWEILTNMNTERSFSSAFCYKSKIYVAGGVSKSFSQLQTIEVYNEEKNSWDLLSKNLHNPIQQSVFYVKDDEVFYFGGKGEEGVTDKKYSLNFK